MKSATDMLAYLSALFFMPFIVVFVVIGAILMLAYSIRSNRSHSYLKYDIRETRARSLGRSTREISQPKFATSNTITRYLPVFPSLMLVVLSFVMLAYGVGVLFFPLFIAGFTLLVLGTPLWAAFYREMEAKKSQR
jgi:Flp pilus assembly protein TadB